MLELSRSLPPLPCPASYNIAQSPDGAPPTPPTPDEHQYTTLLYITTPPSINQSFLIYTLLDYALVQLLLCAHSHCPFIYHFPPSEFLEWCYCLWYVGLLEFWKNGKSAKLNSDVKDCALSIYDMLKIANNTVIIFFIFLNAP